MPTDRLFPVCLAAPAFTGSAAAVLGEMQQGTSFVSSRITSLPAAVSDKVGGAGWMLRKSNLSACETQHFTTDKSHVLIYFIKIFVRKSHNRL